MISLAASALLNVAAQTPALDGHPTRLFIAACLDGSAQRVDGNSTPIPFGDLPSALRGRLGKPDSAQVWKLGGVEDAYLYSLSYSDRGFSPKICGVAARDLALRSASAAVETRLRGGTPSAGSYRPVEWLNEEAGYRALATRTGGYTVLQVNWLNNNLAEVPRTQ